MPRSIPEQSLETGSPDIYHRDEYREIRVLATEIFKDISFALPARGKLAAAREIGQRCGATWFEHSVGDLPEGIPDELEDWSEQCRRTWRSGLVQGWNVASEQADAKE